MSELALVQEEPETHSKFLPDTKIQFAWDATSLELFKRCPRLYQYKMIDGWTTESENIHLRFGIEFHQAFTDYELFKLEADDHDDALRLTIRALLGRIHDWDPEPHTKSEAFKTKRNLVRAVVWYLEKYKDDPAETIIMEDGKPAVEVSFRFELDYGPYAAGNIRGDEEVEYVQPYLLCGHLDRIVSYQDETFIMDHKTASSTIGPYYFNQYDPNTQMSLYTLASQIVLSAPIKGIIINAVQIAADSSKPVRGMTYRSKGQLDEWLEDLRHWLNRAEECATEGYWPMNDTACDKYGGCKFREICSRDPAVRHKFLKSNYVQEEPWNPLRTR